MTRAGAAAVLVAASLLCSPAAAQSPRPFPYDQFSADTLSQYMARIESAATPSNEQRAVLLGVITKIRVRATYLGERRPIDPVTAGIILGYVQGATEDAQAYAALYRDFYAFEDAGRRYWLPVQHQVADHFDGELEPGQRLELYALAVGALAGPNQQLQPLLLVQEFDADLGEGDAPLGAAPAPAD